MVSNSSVVDCSGVSTWFSASAMSAMPVSAPWPTWQPGCMLYSWPGVFSMRMRSSVKSSMANCRVSGLAAAGFIV